MNEREAAEVEELARKLNMLEDLALEWKEQSSALNYRKGQMTREKSPREMLSICATEVLWVINNG